MLWSVYIIPYSVYTQKNTVKSKAVICKKEEENKKKKKNIMYPASAHSTNDTKKIPEVLVNLFLKPQFLSVCSSPPQKKKLFFIVLTRD